jgi:hypothetical protein
MAGFGLLLALVGVVVLISALLLGLVISVPLSVPWIGIGLLVWGVLLMAIGLLFEVG